MDHYTPYRKQTVVGEGGNCWSTCIANILGLRPDAVPNFCVLHPNDWLNKANCWLIERHGLLLMHYRGENPLDPDPMFKQATLLIASGMGPRGHRHSVLWRDGAMVHDPHPSGDGLVGPPDEWEILLAADLSKLGRGYRVKDRFA